MKLLKIKAQLLTGHVNVGAKVIKAGLVSRETTLGVFIHATGDPTAGAEWFPYSSPNGIRTTLEERTTNE